MPVQCIDTDNSIALTHQHSLCNFKKKVRDKADYSFHPYSS